MAGGWGNTKTRRVYSVGVVRTSAGGAVEVVERPDRFLVGAVSSSSGGALRSAGVDCPPSPRSSFSGSTVRASPGPDPVGGGSGRFKKTRMLWCCCASAVLAFRGAGSSEHVKFDYPAASGGLRFQGASGALAAARRLLISVTGDEDGV